MDLKVWYALLLPAGSGRHAKARREERRTVGRMEFKTFVNHFIRIPCQVLRTGRIVCRLLGWNSWLEVFFRFLDERLSDFPDMEDSGLDSLACASDEAEGS